MYKSIIPNSFMRKLNLTLLRDFVNKSANWFSELTNWITQSPLFTWSLIKWWHISMCLVLECCTGFFVKLIALVLSHNKGIWERLKPKSVSCCLIHKLWAQQLPTAMYFTYTVDSATHACFLLCQDIKLDPRRWHVPLVLFLSIFTLQNLSQSNQLNSEMLHWDTIVQHQLFLWDISISS